MNLLDGKLNVECWIGGIDHITTRRCRDGSHICIGCYQDGDVFAVEEVKRNGQLKSVEGAERIADSEALD